jgi:uncharacterized protein (DUF3084 family)
MNTATIIAVISALGVGGILQAFFTWLKDRKKTLVEADKLDAETKLAYLTTVIERLDAEAKRSEGERKRLQEELTSEQERSHALRKRVRELEDELDEVRRSARETENKCELLGRKLRQLVDEAADEAA